MASQYISYSSRSGGGGGGGAGTVTSVGLADASSSPIFNITGSPVTTVGTLTETLKTQSANTVFAGPSGGSAAEPTFRSLVSTDIPVSEQAVTASGAATTVNLATALACALALDASTTLTLSNPVAAQAYVFRIIQGSGSYSVTWPASVLWPGGTPPVITVTAGYTDLVNLYYDGTYFYGSFVQNFAT